MAATLDATVFRRFSGSNMRFGAGLCAGIAPCSGAWRTADAVEDLESVCDVVAAGRCMAFGMVWEQTREWRECMHNSDSAGL